MKEGERMIKKSLISVSISVIMLIFLITGGSSLQKNSIPEEIILQPIITIQKKDTENIITENVYEQKITFTQLKETQLIKLAEPTVLVMTVTAYYTPLPGQSHYVTGSYKGDLRLNGNGITHSGTKAKIGDVAADPKIIPRNTKIYIPEYGEGKVSDIGSNIKGNRLDVYMGRGEEALNKALKFGRKKLKVIILT